MTKLQEILLYIEKSIKIIKKSSDIEITKDTSFQDYEEKAYDYFCRVFPNIKERQRHFTYYFTGSKWLLYKTVYSFDNDFSHILGNTEDAPLHLQLLESLPFDSFFIAIKDAPILGYLVHIELIEFVDKSFGAQIILFEFSGDFINGKPVFHKDTLRLVDEQTIEESLSEWMQSHNTPEENSSFWGQAYANMRTVLNICYYLAAQNAVIREVKIPKVKRPKHPNGRPLNYHQWDVGYRIGEKFKKSNSMIDAPSTLPEMVAHINSPRPHVRRAHWHHYWAGQGKNKLILKWIAPTWVNGTPDDFTIIDHPVE